MRAGPLSGRGIVVTRPREHAPALAERIRAAGGDPILFPTIEILPPENPGAVLARWQSGGIEAVSITSAEGLANFFDMLGPTGRGYLRATPVFVPHQRIALAARKLDVREIVVTGRGDDRTVAEMAAFFATV